MFEFDPLVVDAVRKIHHDHHGKTFGEMALREDMRVCAEWQAKKVEIDEQRRANLERRLELGRTQNKKLDVLRVRMQQASDRFQQACITLENERIRCDKEMAVLEAEDASLAASLMPKLTTHVEVAFIRSETFATDDREVTAAAATPQRTGGGWINPRAIQLGMPGDIGPQSQAN